VRDDGEIGEVDLKDKEKGDWVRGDWETWEREIRIVV